MNNIYQQASKIKLRFATEKGLLTVEQLWDLSQSNLANGIKTLKKVLNTNNDDELSFLDDTKVVDVENQLRFEILKDIYLTKKAEKEQIRSEAETKEHNQKIMQLIQQKRENKLADMSEEELKALLK